MSNQEERRTSPVELFWDLVFVFAVTQVTTLLSREQSWAGFGRAMLVLALMWWAWSAFVWVVNANPVDSPVVRPTLLVATMFIFVAGLSVPHAFGSEGTLFACTYAVVRLLHLGLYVHASRRGNASWAAIAGFGTTAVTGMALLIGGSFVHGTARVALWAIAVAIDYAGPLLTRGRLRELQQVAVAHFAERYGLFVIICLGESIIAIGVGAVGVSRVLSAERVVAVSLGLLITVGMWWTYFDRFAATAEERLRTTEAPVLAASDGYSYLHLAIVAGIITFAVGVRVLVGGAVGSSLQESARLALCGGVALYLAGHVAFRLRMTGSLEYGKLAVAAALLALYALGDTIAAWGIAAGVASLLAILCVGETEAALGVLRWPRREPSIRR